LQVSLTLSSQESEAASNIFIPSWKRRNPMQLLNGLRPRALFVAGISHAQRRGRRRSVARPRLENLENRELLTLNVQSAVAVGAGDIQSLATAVDSSGNSYVVGGFAGSTDFDPGSGTTNLSSAGARDAFLAKYSSTGALLWAHRFGGSGTDLADAIARDSSGNLYIAGSFQNSVTFGSTTLTSKGSSDVFVVKLDSAGNVVWARSAGGSGFDQATAIAVDSAGNVIVSGQFQGSAGFGSTTLNSKGSYDAFVAKYNASGTAQWAHSFGGTGSDTAAGVAVDGSGNAFVTGRFAGSAAFGSTTLASHGSYDAYLAKLSPTGSVTWVHGYGGPGADQGNAVAVDSSGNAYMTGSFSNSVSFGSTTLTSRGLTDAFVAKVSSGGTVLSASGFGGSLSDAGTAINVTATGTTFVAGQFQGTLSFGSGSGASSLSSFGGTDAFLAQISSTGTQQWAQSFGGAGNDTPSGLDVDGTGTVSLTGNYLGPAAFNALALPNVGLTDIFVVRTKKTT
jgi:hypothetical protein